MNYLEAVAILRLNPDNLPRNLAHLPEEATRVVKLHRAMLNAANVDAVTELPVLPLVERDRVNAVLVYNLARECGRLQPWGGPGKKPAIRPIEVKPATQGANRPPIPAQPGDGAPVLERY
jgi:hypothetical protein